MEYTKCLVQLDEVLNYLSTENLKKYQMKLEIVFHDLLLKEKKLI